MIVLFALLYLACASFIPDVPMFAWSGDNFLNGKNLQITEPLSSSDVTAFVASLLSTQKNSVIASYVDLKGKAPEVVVLYLQPKLRTDEIVRFSQKGSLVALQESLKQSASSIFSPAVDLDTPLTSGLVELARSIESVAYCGQGPLAAILSRQVPSLRVIDYTVLEGDSIFTNGVTDLIIVELHSDHPTVQSRLKATDATVALIQSIVSKSTSKYISVYTGLQHHSVEEDVPETLAMPQSHKKRSDFVFAFNDDNNQTLQNITGLHWFNRWFPGWFWELFTIMIIIVTISVYGLFTLAALQVPNKLPTPPKVAARN